jgi:hypothetical protein
VPPIDGSVVAEGAVDEGEADVTAAVAAEDALAEPMELDAVTVTRTAPPTSALPST